MALRDILLRAAPVIGMQITNTSGRLACVDRINAAARELYDSTDLAGCLREEVFETTRDQRMISLPWYVDKIRAVREYEAREKITTNDMRQRYQTNAAYMPMLSWRVKGFSPIQRDITNASLLTFTLATADSVEFGIIITGPTQHASIATETLTVEIGETAVTSTKAFTSDPELRAIRKSIANNVDITVTDASSNVLAVIPNTELESRYTLIQIGDTEDNSTDSMCYEVLFKMRFTPFVSDYDEFPCRGFDDAIYWKVMEHYHSERQGQEQNAILAHQKCVEVVRQQNSNMSAGLKMSMDFGTNRFLSISDEYYSDYRTFLGPPIRS